MFEKRRHFTLEFFRVTSGGNVKHAEANYLFTIEITNRCNCMQ